MFPVICNSDCISGGSLFLLLFTVVPISFTSDLIDSGRLQLTFVFLVLPCLLLGYLGQAAYLVNHHADVEQAFFSSIPSKLHCLTQLVRNQYGLYNSL
jgi:K+ transporter